MQTGITEKLNNFTALVMRDAQEKRSELLADVEKEYSSRIGECETQILEGAYENIQRNIGAVRREGRERVLQAQNELRRRLIERREKMINDVMAEAQERLEQFTSGDEYGSWLISLVRDACFELGEGDKTVYVRAEDMRFADDIKALDAGSVTVSAARANTITGGARVVNIDNKTAVDYTFGEMLDDQKRKFLRGSDLSLG